jgi:hypothetical protein
MALGTRVLTVNLTMPNGDIVTLDQSLDIHVHMHRSASQVQTQCDITVLNLSNSLKQTLLTRINAFVNNQVQQGLIQSAFIPVQVIAGYVEPGQSGQAAQNNSATIFSGQAYLARPVGELPTLGIQITAATNQVDKTRVVTATPPALIPFKQLVAWGAQQIGCPYSCNTSVDDTQVTNPGGGNVLYVSSIPQMLMASVPVSVGRVEVFIDVDGTLVARDLGTTTQAAINMTEFIGQPYSTEWGIQMKVLFDPRVRLISNLHVQSTQNTWLNGGWIPFNIEYSLTSRDSEFYMVIDASAPANAALPS